jgi:hypothetical protein
MKSLTNVVHAAEATGLAGSAGFSGPGEQAASARAMAAPASSRQDRLFLNLDVMCRISSKTTPSTGVVLRRPISKINVAWRLLRRRRQASQKPVEKTRVHIRV